METVGSETEASAIADTMAASIVINNCFVFNNYEFIFHGMR